MAFYFRKRILIAFVILTVLIAAVITVSVSGFTKVEEINDVLIDQINEIRIIADIQFDLSESKMPVNDYLITGNPEEKLLFEKQQIHLLASLEEAQSSAEHSEHKDAFKNLQSGFEYYFDFGEFLMATPEIDPGPRMEAFDVLGGELIEKLGELIQEKQILLRQFRSADSRAILQIITKLLLLSTSILCVSLYLAFALVRHLPHSREMIKQARIGEEHRLLSKVIEQTNDAVVLMGDAGQIIYINEAFEKLFLCSRDVALGENIKAFMPHAIAQHHDEFLNTYKQTGQKNIIGKVTRVDAMRQDGTTFPIDLAVSEVHFQERTRFAGILRDLTERQKLDARLRQAAKMEAVGTLAGGIAHDFNNTLMKINLCCELAQLQLEENEPARVYLERILESCTHASTLVRQLLGFSRRQTRQVKVVDLNEIIRNLMEILKKGMGDDISLDTQLSEDLYRVRIDPGQFEEIILNLISNALDAMPTGGLLTLETSNFIIDEEFCKTHDGSAPGEYVMLSVRDTGCGMSPEVLQNAFEPFYTTKSLGQGTGLGLSMAYGIIKQSQGYIHIESTEGQGTTVSLYLPKKELPLDSKNYAPSLRTSPSSGETVLVVDDEKDIREMLREALLNWGFKVVIAADGERALLEATHHEEDAIHLLITDMIMPGMNGQILAREILRFHPNIRILFMSGYSDLKAFPDGLPSGVHYLNKPVKLDDFAEHLQRILKT